VRRASRTVSAVATGAMLLGLTTVSTVAVEVAAPRAAAALPDGLALTPPMGFNNWNATGCAIDEKLIRDTADIFVSSGLREAGYTYVNIDDCWAAPERDPVTKRLSAHPERFPSGIKALADYVHARGLKLGIYTSAGTQTCARTMPGALDHEEIDAQTFADWEVDYLKYDNCNNQGRPALERYTKMRDALKKTGRPIVFSICEWGQNKPWEWGKDVGHLWRTTGDINDTWPSVVNLLKQNAPLDAYAGPGHWNDPDMLEVGNGGMTDTEYRSHFSLWAMMAAPLLIGSDLRKVGKPTFDILLNKEIIALDQDRLGVQAKVLSNANGHWVFAKPLANGDTAVALFNESETPAAIGTTAEALGLRKRGAYAIRDLWEGKDFHIGENISAVVAPHATVVYRIKAEPGRWRDLPPAADFGLEPRSSVPGVPGTVVRPGQATVTVVTTTNRGVVPMSSVRAELSVPPRGWRAYPLGPTSVRTLRPGGTFTAVWQVVAPVGMFPGNYPLGATLTSRSPGLWRPTVRTVGETLVVPAPVAAGRSDLGDQPWASARNGYGPTERNMSNGGPRPGDGRPLTINGVVYPKGIGAHAHGEIVFYLAGRCANLTVDVGIDDERDPRPLPNQGTATFEIWADGTKVADSGLRTWRDPALPMSATLTGASFLRLVGTVGGDTNSYDRTDWAAPVLTCQG
jgi:alpha-galactosidase